MSSSDKNTAENNEPQAPEPIDSITPLEQEPLEPETPKQEPLKKQDAPDQPASSAQDAGRPRVSAGRRLVQISSGLTVAALVAALGVFGDLVQVPQPQLLDVGTGVSVAAATENLVCPTPVSVATIAKKDPAKPPVSTEPSGADEEEADAPDGQDEGISDELSNAGNHKTEDGTIIDGPVPPVTDEDEAPSDADETQSADETEDPDKPVAEFDPDQKATENLIQMSLVGAGGGVTITDIGIPADSQKQGDKDPAPKLQDFDPISARNPSVQHELVDPNHGLVFATQDRATSDPATGQFSAMTQTSITTQGDTRGIAGAACGTTATEHWLVGGGTSLGTSSKLVVQNPGRTPATVSMTVWGPGGRVPLAGLDTLLVPAGKQVSVFLEGIAAEQRRTAVHIQTTGTLVSAYLQVNTLAGITPKGTDFVTAGSAPSRLQLMSGVVVQDPETTSHEAGTVRLVVPDFADVVDLSEETQEAAGQVGQQPVGTARITLLGQKGQFVLFGADAVELAPGAVVDVDLTGVPEGTYSVLVSADVPVLAATRSTRTGLQDPDRPEFGIPEDYTWTHSSQVISTLDPALQNSTGLKDATPQPAQEGKDAADPAPDAPVFERSTVGALATVKSLDWDLVLTALPQVQTTEELTAALEQVPRFYASDTTSGTEQGTEEELAVREAWKQTQKATVTTFSENGQELTRREIAIAPGQTLNLPLAAMGGDKVRTVLVEPDAQSVIDWAMVATSKDLAGAMSVFQPVVATQSAQEVQVTRSLSVGIK